MQICWNAVKIVTQWDILGTNLVSVALSVWFGDDPKKEDKLKNGDEDDLIMRTI